MSARLPRSSSAAAMLDIEAAGLLHALAVWGSRSDGRPRASERAAADRAMTHIDRMLSALHATKAALAAEISATDKAAASRRDGGAP